MLYVGLAIGLVVVLLGAVIAACLYWRWKSRKTPLSGNSTTTENSQKRPSSPIHGQTKLPERSQRNPLTSKHAWTPAADTGPLPQAGSAPGADRKGPTPGNTQGLPGSTSPSPVLPEAPRFIVDGSEPFYNEKEALAAELEISMVHETLEVRRRRFKDLCLQHHPDKNGNSDESKSMFQFLLAQKATYLGDGG